MQVKILCSTEKSAIKPPNTPPPFSTATKRERKKIKIRERLFIGGPETVGDQTPTTKIATVI